MPCWVQFPNQGRIEWAIFRSHFLDPSPNGASRVDPKEGCLVILGAAEGDCHSPSLPTTIYLVPPYVQVLD